MSKNMLENNYLEYILTYKLSQDVVELYFAMMRRLHGYNNNPNAVQVISTTRRILSIFNELMIPRTGNCLPPDETFRSEDHDSAEFGVTKSSNKKKIDLYTQIRDERGKNPSSF